MGIIVRQGILSTIVIYFGFVLGYVNVALLFPKFFSAAELGLRTTLVDLTFILGQLSLLGFGGVVFRFFPSFKEKDKLNSQFIKFVLTTPLIGFSLIIALFLLLFSTNYLTNYYSINSPLLLEYLYLIPFLVLFVIYNQLFEALIKTFNQAAFPVFIREVLLRVLTTVAIALYAFNLISITSFWHLFAATYLISLIILIIFFISSYASKISRTRSPIDATTKKSIRIYASYAILSGLASNLAQRIDTIMIGLLMFDGLRNVGIYTMAVFMAAVIEMPRRGINQMIAPVISAAWSKNNLSEISSTYKKASIILLIAGGFIFMCLWLNIDEIYAIIPKSDVFIAGKYAFLLLGITKLIEMTTSVNSEIISYSLYYKYNLYFLSILAVVNIVLNILLIPIYGITGAAMATMLSNLCFNLLKMGFIYVKFKMQPFSKNTVIVLALLGIVFLVGYLPLPFSNNFLTIAVRCSIISLIYIPTVYILQVSTDFNAVINKLLQMIRMK